MGKKKKQNQDKNESEEAKKPVKENKGPKSYKGTTTDKSSGVEKDKLQKIILPADKESVILDLILSYKSRQTNTGSISQRLSSKKLTDLYNALSDAGFKEGQIEQGMNNVVQYGGDLIDALDWLCLNLQDDQLPRGFSYILSKTGKKEKKKPKFNSQQKQTSQDQSTVTSPQQPVKAEATEGAATQASPQKKEDVKDWIMRYAEQSSDSGSEEEGEEEEDKDINSEYLELTAKLLDAKENAAFAKEQGDKGKQKTLSGNIKTYLQRMEQIETLPPFNPQIKYVETKPEPKNTPQPSPPKQPKASLPKEEDSEDVGDLGLGMFEEQVAAEKPKPKPKQSAQKFEMRDVSFTRQQWTGKHPKQFLIDWVRKHLPKSKPPSYEKVSAGGNRWRARCRVQRPDGDLVVLTDKIVTDNVKDAEMVASTLALYELCKGQRVYNLLPPPYRDMWMEWQDVENASLAANKEKENKPRDQYIAKLLKKLKIDTTKSDDSKPDESGSVAAEPDPKSEVVEAEFDGEDEEEVGDTWEDLLSDEETDGSSPETKKKVGVSTARLRQLLENKQAGNNYCKLLQTRIQLPVYNYKEAIVEAVRKNSVLVIAGDTGSGKSTQIPHFIVEDLISCGIEGNVVCTEPRRISAISLAQRVCEELGEGKPGAANTLCGYQIRFESKKCDTTRVLYCTTGVLLRKLQLDPLLSDTTHVIVDEVHERSVQSDFLLIVLRMILEKRPNFKVILMSATADSSKFSRYFKHCPVFSIPGRMFPVQVFNMEDILERTKYTLEEDSPYALRAGSLVQEEKAQVQVTGKGNTSYTTEVSWTKDNINTIDTSGLDPAVYSLRTRNVLTRLDPDRINMDLIVELIAVLDSDPDLAAIPGAVLVFMPGLSHIQELHDLLKSDPRFCNEDRYQLIALHSVLSSSDQSKAFSVPPEGVRKIVIATNIAETGITIPDVVFVVDTGKVKETKYMETSQMSSLQEVWISQASGKQRAGRAGRVRDGFCFRLYPHSKWEQLKAYTVPEILRVPLEELCLHIMKSDLGHPVSFLGAALDPPAGVSIERAMSVLKEVGAVQTIAGVAGSSCPSLTPLGHHLAALPVTVRIGKMLVYAAVLGSLQPMSVIAACMTEKSPFASPMGKRNEADAARAAMAIANSDHITMFKAFVGWKDAQSRGYAAEMQYCNRNFLKRATLMDIENVAGDLQKLLLSIGFQPYSADQLLKLVKRSKCIIKDGVLNISETGETLSAKALSPQMIAVMKSILVAGLYPNVATVTYDQPVDSIANPTKQVCMATTQQGPAAAHPASVNRFLEENGFVVYHEKVRLSRVYLRDSTLVSGLPLLLFGGDIEVHHSQQLLSLDDWIKFKAPARTGVMIKELRVLLEDLLARKLSSPELNVAGEPLVQLLLELIVSERTRT